MLLKGAVSVQKCVHVLLMARRALNQLSIPHDITLLSYLQQDLLGSLSLGWLSNLYLVDSYWEFLTDIQQKRLTKTWEMIPTEKTTDTDSTQTIAFDRM